jgi:hypothetical protein
MKDQNEKKQEDDKILLQKEIESWNDQFGYALREENRILFNKMLIIFECLTNNILKLLTPKEKVTLPNHCLSP